MFTSTLSWVAAGHVHDTEFFVDHCSDKLK